MSGTHTDVDKIYKSLIADFLISLIEKEILFWYAFCFTIVNLREMELEMDLIRCLLATFLLVFSSQSLALFMPDGFKVNTDNTTESDGGCGVIVTELKTFGEN